MPSNIGTQTIAVKFFDPVDSVVANRIALGVRKLGIYSGGYLTKTNDTTVTLSALNCEIGDGTTQVFASTNSIVSITVSTTNVYVVLRWAYTGSSVADYMDFIATATPQTNDVIVGRCSFVGSTLSGFDYTLRTTPNIQDLFLKVEPSLDASNPLKVRVRAGKVNYGATNYDIVDQVCSSNLTPPGSGSYVYLVQVSVGGAVTLSTPSLYPTIPNYSGLVTLAEVTIPSGSTIITSNMIKDVRAFVAGSSIITLDSILPSQTGNAGKSLVTNGSIGLWDYPTYAP